MTTLNLKLYIDSSLLGNLATFTFSRVVNGRANVIFQSMTNNQLLFANDFAWDQKYKIGASKSFASGTYIHADTSQRDIQSGYACPFASGDLQPEATAPASFPTGSFGTIDLPSNLYNAIYSATGTDSKGNTTYAAIYADANAVDGLTNRSYIVDNNYVVSWEEDSNNLAAGVYYKQWSNPWSFSYDVKQSAGYISWGPPTGGGTAQFYWYGATDPGGHDPSKAIPTGSNAKLSSSQAPAAPATPSVDVQLGWAGVDWLSSAGKAQYAYKTAEYLAATKPSFLDLTVTQKDADGLSAVAVLNGSDSIYDFLDGLTREEKTALVLQSLLRGASSKYAPSEQKLQFHVSNVDAAGLGNWRAAFDLAWAFLGANGTQLAALGIPVAYSWIQGIINKKYSGYKNVTISYNKPSISGSKGSATFTIEGVLASDAPGIIKDISAILNNEEARKAPPPSGPTNLPTPDPLTYTEQTPQLVHFGGVLVA